MSDSIEYCDDCETHVACHLQRTCHKQSSTPDNLVTKQISLPKHSRNTMKKYTTAMGTNCSYLVHDGFHIAKSNGNSREDHRELDFIAADLNGLALLRESHARLMRTIAPFAGFACSPEEGVCGCFNCQAEKALDQAQALIDSQKPHSGDFQVKEATPAKLPEYMAQGLYVFRRNQSRPFAECHSEADATTTANVLNQHMP